MKTLTFNANSVHHKLAVFGNLNEYRSTDICTYTRSVLWGLFKFLGCVLLSLVLVVFASTALVEVVLSVVFSLYTGTFMFSELGLATAIVLVVVGIFVGVKFTYDKIGEHSNDPRSNKPDGFIKSAYRSFKGKYCVRVTFNH